MIFSHRYHKAIEDGRLNVDLPHEIRNKLWSWASYFDGPLQITSRNGWNSSSSVLEEAKSELQREHGWDRFYPGAFPEEGDEMSFFFRNGQGHHVFDAIELMIPYLTNGEKDEFRKKVNEVFDVHSCPWRISDGEFFKLDNDFVGLRLAASAHEALFANRFAGATDEFARARRETVPGGEPKDAIFYACKSFESVLNVLTGLNHANAVQLGNEFIDQGYLDDLPEDIRQGFVDQVLRALPFLRNKLSGHGQGPEVRNIPPAYGQLAVQIGAAFHNFLISKHLEHKQSEEAEPLDAISDDDIPF